MGIRIGGAVGNFWKRNKGAITGLLVAGPGGAWAGHHVDARTSEKNRRNSRIEEAYANAVERLGVHQGDVRQSQVESLVARGLAPNASAATVPKIPGASSIMSAFAGKQFAKQPTTLGAQTMTDLEKEFGLERKDLDFRKRTAMEDSKQEFVDDLSNDALGAAKTAAGFAGGIPGGANVTAARSPIQGAFMQGIDNPSAWYGGIHGLDPLDAPGSSWNRKGTMIGDGQSNYEFTA